MHSAITTLQEAAVGAVTVAAQAVDGPDHLLVLARCLSLTGLLVGVVGLAGRWLAWPLLTSTVGPTAYLFATHPRTEPARLRNAVIGHVVAMGVGLRTLSGVRARHHPSVSRVGTPSWRQVFASAIAVGSTMAVLELLHSHHAPAAATALLITTGLARPGAPLIGLVLGLAIVIALGPDLRRWPLHGRHPCVRRSEGTGELG